MNFVTKLIILLALVCLTEMSYARKGSKHRKHPEKSNSSEMDNQNSANGSVAVGTRKETTQKKPSPTPKPVRVKLVHQRNSRKHVVRRCCGIGYRAAKRKLFCMVDRYYSAKYTNMEHYARQRFQGRKPSRATRRFMHHLDRFCIKTQLKSVFYKCCKDGISTARTKRPGK